MKITKQQQQILERWQKQEDDKLDRWIAELLNHDWKVTYAQELNK